MAVLQSHVDKNAEWFHENRADMLEQLAIIDELSAEAAAGGGAAGYWRFIFVFRPSFLSYQIGPVDAPQVAENIGC